jgi:hypothetical protein
MTEKMSFSEFKAQFTEKLYDEYHVVMQLRDVAGGIPMHSDLIKGWIDATNKDKSDEERQKIVDATVEALPEVSEEKEAKSWVGFKRDDSGNLYIEGRCIKAMLKEAGNILKDIVPNGGKQIGKNKDKKVGVTALKSKVADRVFVVEERVYFLRDGQRIQDVDELEERPVHAMTPQGPRSSLKRTDILRNVTVEFTVRRLASNDVPEETLFGILVYAQQLGLGADRSQGRGVSTDVTCEKIKEAAAA